MKIINSKSFFVDTNNKPIYAHGAQIIYEGGYYYWIGENKEKSTRLSHSWTYGIRAYRSKDLCTFEDLGLIIPPSKDPRSPLEPGRCLDRPHIIYNHKTKKYVMWIKIMVSLISQAMVILTSDKLLGPYQIVKNCYHPLDMNCGDFDLYVDEKTNKGYIFFERPHFELITAELTDDYLACNGVFSEHYKGLIPPLTREGVTHFVRNGTHYLITSGTTGYDPNVSWVASFDDYHGEYRDLGILCINDKNENSFNMQVSDVIKVQGKKDLYIALGDVWRINGDSLAYSIKSREKIAKAFKNYQIDERKVTDDKLPNSKFYFHNDNTKSSSFKMFPLIFENDQVHLYNIAEFSLEDYD